MKRVFYFYRVRVKHCWTVQYSVSHIGFITVAKFFFFFLNPFYCKIMKFFL
jgi:hypothetical protein